VSLTLTLTLTLALILTLTLTLTADGHRADRHSWSCIAVQFAGFVSAMLLIVLAMLSKELGLAHLAVLAAMDAMHCRINPLGLLLLGRGMQRPSSSVQHTRQRLCVLFAVRLAMLAAVGGAAAWMRVRIMHGKPHFTAHNNPAAFVSEPSLRCSLKPRA
jgi:hypothetical protein